MFFLTTALWLMAAAGCAESSPLQAKNETDEETEQVVSVPTFSADSAYHYVERQVAFGPRVPNTDAHTACAEYLAAKLESFGAAVTVQRADLTAYNGTLLHARNIVGSYLPQEKKRIALFAHWDSRPWADCDPDPANHYKPILGANDGASGVGVLLEIARQLQQTPPGIGVDIILLDAEDMGYHRLYEGTRADEAWALGAQYWARVPHVSGYNARFGILLDMVGGRDARFLYEYFSEQYARDINRKVWDAAKRAGAGQYFVKKEGDATTDDHLFINTIARIPTIDIIPTSEYYVFFKQWHTMSDDMQVIDPNTLRAVGQTVLQVIYEEKP